jgi:hypothetical protein
LDELLEENDRLKCDIKQAAKDYSNRLNRLGTKKTDSFIGEINRLHTENEHLKKLNKETVVELFNVNLKLSETQKDLAYQKHLADSKSDRNAIAQDNSDLRAVIRELNFKMDAVNKHCAALQMDNTALRNNLDLETRQHQETIRVLDGSLENARHSRRDLYVLAVAIGALAGNSDARIKDYPIDADALMAAVDKVKS